jgi:hypothetical protein
MKRWRIALLVTVSCGLSAVAGYWLGFRDAWGLAVAADRLPRGVVAVQHLRALKAGSTENIAVSLEFDVDNGLVWGYEILEHPMRPLWHSLWDLDVGPQLERYATRVADYRRDNPSLMRAGAKNEDPEGAEIGRRLSVMVERYATKR